MPRILAFLFLFFLVSEPGLTQGGPSARVRIAGTVEAEGGVPGNTAVMWTREIAVGSPEVSRHGAVAVSPQGAFDISDLPAGSYTVCAKSNGHDYLDPCLWGAPLRVSIAEGETQAKTGFRLQLKRGSRLRLTFSDPSGLLHSPSSPNARAAIRAGLWLSTGRYVAMQHSVVRGGRQVFEAVVPSDAVVRVQVRVVGADFHQVLDGRDEDDVGFPKNPAGFGVRTARAGVKTLRFTLQP